MAGEESSKKRSSDIFHTPSPSVSALKKLKADPLIIILDHPSSSWAFETEGGGREVREKTEDQVMYLKPSSISLKPSTAQVGSLRNPKTVVNNESESSEHEKMMTMSKTEHPRQDTAKSSSKSMTPTKNQPYKKFPSTNEKGWLETCVGLGVTRPLLCFNKRVTNSDADPNQHRFQLTGSEIFNKKSTQPALKELARKAEKLAPTYGVAVKVMDRMGHLYNMMFRYNAKTGNYRFMGADYSEFLKRTKLRVDQRMDIWELPDVRSKKGFDHWLAFLNSEPDHFKDDNIDDDGIINEVKMEILPTLPHWCVKLF